MNVPNLNDLIKAIECEEWRPSKCKVCSYGYLDDHGDTPVWTCDEARLKEESLFYLKLYQYLIEKEKIN